MDEENRGSGTAAEQETAEKPKKQRKGRRSYLRDIRPSADGKYRYVGECYAYDEKLNPRLAVLLRLWLLAAPAAVACVISGCLSAPFMKDTWYVIGPFGFELVALGSVVWAIGRITGNGEILRSYVRKQTFGSLTLRCSFAIGFAAVGLIGAFVYIFVHGTALAAASGTDDRTAACIVYLVLKAVNIACCILIMRYARSIVWKESAKKI